jgi:hypothetical protein
MEAAPDRSRHRRRPKMQSNPKDDGAQMPDDKASNSDNAQNFKDSIFRNLALLTLPWLSFQQDMLAIMKRGIEDTSHVKPVQKLTLLELHALMMILDPSRTWRSPFDANFEKKVEDTYKEAFPKLVSFSIDFIEAQEMILKQMSDAMVTLKNGNKTKSHGK